MFKMLICLVMRLLEFTNLIVIKIMSYETLMLPRNFVIQMIVDTKMQIKRLPKAKKCHKLRQKSKNKKTRKTK